MQTGCTWPDLIPWYTYTFKKVSTNGIHSLGCLCCWWFSRSNYMKTHSLWEGFKLFLMLWPMSESITESWDQFHRMHLSLSLSLPEIKFPARSLPPLLKSSWLRANPLRCSFGFGWWCVIISEGRNPWHLLRTLISRSFMTSRVNHSVQTHMIASLSIAAFDAFTANMITDCSAEIGKSRAAHVAEWKKWVGENYSWPN